MNLLTPLQTVEAAQTSTEVVRVLRNIEFANKKGDPDYVDLADPTFASAKLFISKV